MGHWVNLDRRAKTPIPALRVRWEGKRTANGRKRGRGRGMCLRRDTGGCGAGERREGGVSWR